MNTAITEHKECFAQERVELDDKPSTCETSADPPN